MTSEIYAELTDDVRKLRAMAIGLTNPMAVPLTDERKKHLADYLVSLSDRIESVLP